MIAVLARRRTARREDDRLAVLTAMGMLRPECASVRAIGRLAYLNEDRTRAALSSLERAGMVAGEWVGDRHPRIRLYRVVERVAS